MIDSAAVGVAQLNLSYTRITAPINGRVGLRTVDGSFNNLLPGNELLGAADQLFPRVDLLSRARASPLTP